MLSSTPCDCRRSESSACLISKPNTKKLRWIKTQAAITTQRWLAWSSTLKKTCSTRRQTSWLPRYCSRTHSRKRTSFSVRTHWFRSRQVLACWIHRSTVAHREIFEEELHLLTIFRWWAWSERELLALSCESSKGALKMSMLSKYSRRSIFNPSIMLDISQEKSRSWCS